MNAFCTYLFKCRLQPVKKKKKRPMQLYCHSLHGIYLADFLFSKDPKNKQTRKKPQKKPPSNCTFFFFLPIY